MTATGSHEPETAPPEGMTPRALIDETPQWSDGTDVGSAPLTRMQWLIWLLTAAGKFFEGALVFLTGVALPLVAREYGLDAAAHGLVAAATLAGILVGATLLGGLADRYGRKPIFVVETILLLFFMVGIAVSPSFSIYLVCLFGAGVALGGDYPTAHLVLSEAMPSRGRGRFVLSAFAFQAAGALFGTLVGFLVLSADPTLTAWRVMYAVLIVPVLVVLIGRFFITESAPWLLLRGRVEEAERAVAKLLSRRPPYPSTVSFEHARHRAKTVAAHAGFRALFAPANRRATMLASVPWFLQDLGTYGIGIFTPTILATALGAEKAHASNVADIVSNDLIAAKGSAAIDLLLIVGIGVAVLLADRVGRIGLQVVGFIGCAAGLALAAASAYVGEALQLPMIFAGFMLFNFMTNMGPNAQTYLIAGEVFPAAVRGAGAGLAASVAKVGAVMTAFLFPVLLSSIGQTALLAGLVATSVAGALITWAFRIETAGKRLDD